MSKTRTFIALSILCALTALIYSNIINGPFIFDDGMYIAKNPAIRDLANFWPPSGARYVAYLTFALNYALGGVDTTGYHLFNIAVHILNSMIVFWLVTLILRTPWFAELKEAQELAFPLALIASFVFATHPVQTQAVTYITQRFASLAALFYLLAIALYLKWRFFKSPAVMKAAIYALSLASAVLAQNTKEISFTLPVVMALMEFAFFGGLKGFGRRVLPLIPFMLTMLIVPLVILGPELGIGGAGTGIGETTRGLQIRDLTKLSRHDYLVTQFRVIVTYFRLLVLPAGQNLDYDYPLYRSLFTPEVFASFIFVAALFAISVYLFIRAKTAGCVCRMMIASGILFFFISMSIESSVIPINDLIYEHRLYLPLAGASVAFAAMCIYAARAARKRFGLKLPLTALAVMIAVITAVPLSAASYLRNNVWTDEIRFWNDAVKKSPGKARVHNNLGYALYKKGETDGAVAHFKEAIALKPDFADAHYNLGTAYKDYGLMDEAIREYELALAYEPGRLNARNNLGLAYYTVGRHNEALVQFVQVLELDPANYRAHNNLGLVYSSLGRIDDAIEEFRTALLINPGFEDAYNNLRDASLKKEGGR